MNVKESLSSIITLRNHPFFIGVVDNENIKNMPITIDLKLGVDQKFSIPRILLNDEILSALKKAYSMGHS